MSGHNKWSKIKNKKGAEDAKKSNLFSKLSRQIIAESKKCSGDVSSPSLATAIEIAKKENMPKDTIDRAIKKGADKDSAVLEPVTYEAYGPGGTALIIEGLTDNKNRTAAEVRHLLSKKGIELAAQGAASWAFSKEGPKWVAKTTVDISEEDGGKLGDLLDELEELEDVQEVFSNAN
jgi:YebC/PmpR family DNA-binding regulatory protein